MEKNFVSKLDPVTFEVLKNSFINLVDQMSEQILRTCYSFVIYNRDFSCALCDAEGNTVMQGTQDIAVHVGTLHLTAKAVIEDFGEDINPGDVFLVNDPYRGGTHFNDVRVVRPVFFQGQLIAFMQANGHWADIGSSVPGSFDVSAKDIFGEGMRITPVRLWSKGEYLEDVANLLVSNMRVPEERLGDLRSQSEATKVSERELLRLVNRYGVETVLTAFQESQDYVESLTRARLKELPDGSWETTDYIDMDPEVGDGMIPIKVKLTIDDDEVLYDFEGTHQTISCFLNGTYGASLSSIYAGTKTFFPDTPLNSGFYRVIKANLPEDTVVNSKYPAPVAGFVSGSHEKIMNSCFELWSYVIPERALACSFNLEYLLIGGWDERSEESNYFMWYDWMAGGHGGRIDRDGANTMSPVFGVGLSVQPCEGQERLTPVVTTNHEIIIDSGGPGEYRGGCGVQKGGTLTTISDSVMSVCCDRSRSVTWGIMGGLPSIPHGNWLNPEKENEEFLGAFFSNVRVKEGDSFTRPSSGGGGLGDPLKRKTSAVLEDVIDGYVSVERAKRDYGVVINEIDEEVDLFEVDENKTQQMREYIQTNREDWINKDAHEVYNMYLKGDIDKLDLIRQYGVIIDYSNNELLEKSTEQFRENYRKRTLSYWD